MEIDFFWVKLLWLRSLGKKRKSNKILTTTLVWPQARRAGSVADLIVAFPLYEQLEAVRQALIFKPELSFSF